MIIDINSFIPLATIVGAAAAPTIAAIWAESKRSEDAKRAAQLAVTAAMKVAEVKSTLVETAAATTTQLGEIHTLVNNQLSEAVARFDKATAEIVSLKALVMKLQAGARARTK